MELLWEDRSGATLPPETDDLLCDLFKRGLAYENIPDTAEVEISLSIVTPEEIRSLNNEYRGQDRETDVLSFPFYEPPLPEPDGMPLALGDIVICAQVAETQAEAYGHSYVRELSFLAVHGLLHLLGYDHETPEDEQDMTEAQEAILRAAGINR